MNRWLIVLVLISCVLATAWVLQGLDEKQAPAPQTERGDPDFYMENFVRTAMNEQGALKERLYADFMVHYPDDDSNELVRPRMEIYNGSETPWQVMADRGWVAGNNEVILLYGEVEIWRSGANGEREFEVLTRDLRILPEDEYAETDAFTTINTRTSVTTAIGMRAKFGTPRIQLMSEVKSRHEID